jgi:hypothetical protein
LDVSGFREKLGFITGDVFVAEDGIDCSKERLDHGDEVDGFGGELGNVLNPNEPQQSG